MTSDSGDSAGVSEAMSVTGHSIDMSSVGDSWPQEFGGSFSAKRRSLAHVHNSLATMSDMSLREMERHWATLVGPEAGAESDEEQVVDVRRALARLSRLDSWRLGFGAGSVDSMYSSSDESSAGSGSDVRDVSQVALPDRPDSGSGSDASTDHERPARPLRDGKPPRPRKKHTHASTASLSSGWEAAQGDLMYHRHDSSRVTGRLLLRVCKDDIDIDLTPALERRDLVRPRDDIAAGLLAPEPRRAVADLAHVHVSDVDGDYTYHSGAASCCGRLEHVVEFREPQLRGQGYVGVGVAWRGPACGAVAALCADAHTRACCERPSLCLRRDPRTCGSHWRTHRCRLATTHT